MITLKQLKWLISIVHELVKTNLDQRIWIFYPRKHNIIKSPRQLSENGKGVLRMDCMQLYAAMIPCTRSIFFRPSRARRDSNRRPLTLQYRHFFSIYPLYSTDGKCPKRDSLTKNCCFMCSLNFYHRFAALMALS